MEVKPNFTGTITDSLGRKIKFVEGKRVAGGQDASKAAPPVSVKPVDEKKYGVSHLPVGKLEPEQPEDRPLNPTKSFFENAKTATYVDLDNQKRIGGILGVNDWVLRKVTEKDVQKLDAIASRLRDPEQAKALNEVINKVDNAAVSGGYSFIPKGTIHQQANKPKPLPVFVGVDTPKYPVSKSIAKPGPEKRGVENTVPVEPSDKPLKTHSILSHRSPKNRITDRKRTKGETTYSNIIHNQTEPTHEEYKSLQGDVHKLGRQQLMRLVRRFKVDLGHGETHKSMKQLRKGVSDHIQDLLAYGKQGEGEKPELGKDRRSGKHSNESFTQFRPVRKY